LDTHPDGFQWIDGSDAANSVISFARWGKDRRDLVLVVGNFTPVPRYNYRVGAPLAGHYREVINSDDTQYGGGGVLNSPSLSTDLVEAHGHAQSLSLTLPPLGTILLRYIGE
jgi:1,4-alpha-glucan branching enzyme